MRPSVLNSWNYAYWKIKIRSHIKFIVEGAWVAILFCSRKCYDNEF